MTKPLDHLYPEGELPERSRPANERLRILLVEDEPSDALIVSRLLRNTGCDIVFEQVSRLTHAEALLRQEQGFDLVVADLNLPDSRGLDTVERLRKLSDTPIVVLTGEDDPQLGVAAVAAGAQDFLKKNTIEGESVRRAVLFAKSRHEAESRLREAQRMEAIGRIANGVAHDFNNILALLMTNTEELAALLPNREARDLTDEMKAVITRASSLVAQLVGYSQKLPIRHVPSDVAKLIEREEARIEAMLPKGLGLDKRLQADLPQISVDRGAFSQALLNLCVNAKEAMEGQLGVIRIQVRRVSHTAGEGSYVVRLGERSGQFVAIAVEDDGPGIPRRRLADIFDPFFTTKPIGAGSGLGLASVQGIVRQHAGWVGVKTELGRGTRVELFFPLIESS